MTLAEQLAEDLKMAMKSRDKVRLSVVRMVRAAVRNQEIDKGQGLTDEETLAVIQKELKQRRDSLEAFQQANRSDLAEQTLLEIDILNEYLPKQLTSEELADVVKEVIASVGATGKADMGKVMGQLMPKIRGRADGKAAQALVQQYLG